MFLYRLATKDFFDTIVEQVNETTSLKKLWQEVDPVHKGMEGSGRSIKATLLFLYLSPDATNRYKTSNVICKHETIVVFVPFGHQRFFWYNVWNLNKWMFVQAISWSIKMGAGLWPYKLHHRLLESYWQGEQRYGRSLINATTLLFLYRFLEILIHIVKHWHGYWKAIEQTQFAAFI